MVRTLTLGLFLIAAASCCSRVVAQTVITLDYPGGVNTQADAIAGNLVLGQYDDPNRNSTTYGFVYDLSAGSYVTTFGYPQAETGYGTYPYGISGDNVVGSYVDSAGKWHGFMFDLSTSAFTNLDSQVIGTRPIVSEGVSGISGDTIIGDYTDPSDYSHGFIYNLSTSAFTTLDDPLAAKEQGWDTTTPSGISGNYVAGSYGNPSGIEHGFLYNISTQSYITLDDPFRLQPLDRVRLRSLG